MAKSPATPANKPPPALERQRAQLNTLVQDILRKDKSLNELLNLRKEDAPRFIALASKYLETNELESAQTAAETAVACDPENPEAVVALGVTLAKNKEFSRAALCFEKAVALRPQDVAQWTNLGECLLGSLKYPEAAAAFRRAMELDPGSEHPQGRRARSIVARTLIKLQKDQK